MSGAPEAGRTTETDTQSPATLPGTRVRADAWAQFHRRMQLRRETTCVAALRRAMEAGDHQAALARAKELVEIDPAWKEIQLFLEDVQARPRAPAPPAVPVVDAAAVALVSRATAAVSDAVEPPKTAVAADTAGPAETVVERHPASAAPGPRRSRVIADVAAVLIVSTIAGWMLAPLLPIEAIRHWMTAPSRRTLPSAPSKEPHREAAPSTPATPPAAEPSTPDLPLAGIVPPPEPTSGSSADREAEGSARTTRSPGSGEGEKDEGNRFSQKRNETNETGPQPDPVRGTGSTARAAGSQLSSTSPPSSVVSSTPATTSSAPSGGSRPDVSNPSTRSSPGDAVAAVSPDKLPMLPAVPVLPGAPASVAPPSPPASGAAPPSSPASIAAPSLPPASVSPSPAPPTSPPSSLAASPRGEAEANALPVEREDQAAIERTLATYAQAYTALNAPSVKTIWPTVNEDELRRAFGQLESQRVAFSGCSVTVTGLHATARCRGQATYVPKVGSGDRVSTSREWQFSLRKRVNTWVIESAAVK